MTKYNETFATWNKIADLYASVFMDLDLYNSGYKHFCNLLPKNKPKVLEIGCGPGNISKFILSQIPNAEIDGIDVSPAMITLAKKNNPKGDFYVMDARSIQIISKQFHGIASGFCIPYLSKSDVKKLIIDCRVLLKSGGILYFSFVDNEYGKSGFQTGPTGLRTYFYYHESEWLLSSLENAGFELIEKSKVIYPKKDGNPEEHTILLLQAI